MKIISARLNKFNLWVVKYIHNGITSEVVDKKHLGALELISRTCRLEDDRILRQQFEDPNLQMAGK